METYTDQILDSPSKNSYIGSYYQPPDRILSVPKVKETPVPPPLSLNLQGISPQVSRATPTVDSKAVIDALRTLQEKIKRLELERKQAELTFQQYSQGTRKSEQHTASASAHSQAPVNLPERESTGRKELGSQLQSAEARCRVLEKQLDYMKKMVENAEKEKNALTEKQASLQNEKPASSTSNHTQKLAKLEKECLKLSKTQTLAEMKLAALEQKLLKEEHERKLVQEKADELQRELDLNLQLCPPATEETKPRRKTKTTPKRASRQSEPASPSCLKGKRMPFVAGTSTSPSHSVHANVQAILHMMKHHQPQLCERMHSLQTRSSCGAKRNLRRDLSSSSITPHEPVQAAPSLGSLSDLLLALQDELGQMSFEHQELVRQIDATHDRGLRDDLERELEGLVNKMEEKGAQILKLRKHQKAVLKLTQQAGSNELKAKKANGNRPPVPSPIKAQQHGRKGGATHNLQLLRETQRFRNSLKQDDLSWET
ncbi:centrosomal protein CEP57L1 isoform X1 [Myripristis murdjan]|uniref:Centrosomal protein 57kDa-like protein 1 n=1 Tax=Myripristis murdjan TaxID=586833 RepID=A0A667X7G8_9TELE|nr:centrosomal protein CEP57L1 isoform X1 [Myripristis murdjan]